MTKFLREVTSLPPYELRNHEGAWRMLTVRTACDSAWRPSDSPLATTPDSVNSEAGMEEVEVTSPIMALVAVQTKGYDTALWEAERSKLVAALTRDGKDKSISVLVAVSGIALLTKCIPPSSPLSSVLRPSPSPLVIQENNEKSLPTNEGLPWVPLVGNPILTGRLCGLQFDISPDAFFQVNAPATELLYNKVKEWALISQQDAERIVSHAHGGRWVRHANEPLPDAGKEAEASSSKEKEEAAGSAEATETTERKGEETHESAGVGILDLCCGTGTIGLCLAKHVDYVRLKSQVSVLLTVLSRNCRLTPFSLISQVVGVEMVESAVEDAKRGAEKNGVKNISFLVGKAEQVTGQAVGELLQKVREAKWGAAHASDGSKPVQIVAVVDPPRPGLHGDVLK